jgi:hypothetical protein
MKYIAKFLLMACLLAATAGQLQAQSGRSPEQVKSSTNRPKPDRREIERKIELMRANARKQENQMRLAEAEKKQALLKTPVDKNVPATIPVH